MRKALAVARKETRQTLRDVRTLAVILVMPVFFLWLYGYALNFDIRHLALAVSDRDGSAASREVVSAFVNSEYFDFVDTAITEEDVSRLFDRGEAQVVLVVPERFERTLRSGRRATVQVLVDGGNANTASTAVGYATAIVRGVSLSLQRKLRGGEIAVTPIVAEPRVWFNPELRSTIFLVPGLVAFLAMITAVVSTALSIVREKERGTMEQIRMAPIGTLSYVVGKSVPYFVLSFVSSIGVLLLAMAIFGVPMRGSWALLLVATGLFLTSALGMGLLISTLADSQQVAFQISIVASFLPTFILSGFIFPIASMPGPIQLVTLIVPARYYLVALRGIVLKGVGLQPLIPDLAAMAVFATLVLGLAAFRLSREHV